MCGKSGLMFARVLTPRRIIGPGVSRVLNGILVVMIDSKHTTIIYLSAPDMVLPSGWQNSLPSCRVPR
jgi:hypothetical protein